MTELRADNWYTVTGRGQMAAINLRQIPGCPERINTVAEIPIRIGQRVRIADHGDWDVAGVEYAIALISPRFIMPNVSLCLRKPQVSDADETAVLADIEESQRLGERAEFTDI